MAKIANPLNENQLLAVRISREDRVPTDLVMATIQGETNFRNIRGTIGAVAPFELGFGQVILRWWFDVFQEVAREMRISIPHQNPFGNWILANHEPHWEIIRKNDELSMRLAVRVIRRIWERAGRVTHVIRIINRKRVRVFIPDQWTRFTIFYVGAGVTDGDIERRRGIYRYWQEVDFTPFLARLRVAPVASAVPPPVVVARRRGLGLFGLGRFIRRGA